MSEEIIRFNTNDLTEPNRMMHVQLFDLVPETDPVLKEVLPEFDFKNPPADPVLFASRLVETCKHHRGVSLSANQCGFKHRVFVMGAGDEYVAFFNPKLIAESDDKLFMMEGCLSFPLLGLHIERSAGIVVEFHNHLGELKRENLTGISARCFLHELDHMDGIVYTDRAKPLALKSGQEKRQKTIREISKAQANYMNMMKKIEKLNDGKTAN
jgi:peptide deformylase